MGVREGSANCPSDISKTEDHSKDELPKNDSTITTEVPKEKPHKLHGSGRIKSTPRKRAHRKNPFHMRQLTLSSISSSHIQAKQTLSAQAAGSRCRRRYMTSASRSLDLLRLNVQNLINRDLDLVIKKYLDIYFKPGIENIRKNLGEDSVTVDNINAVCRQILEDAKAQYLSLSQYGSSSPSSDSDNESSEEYRINAFRSPLSISQKLKESDTDSEASQSAVKSRKRGSKSLLARAIAPMKHTKVEPIKRDGPKWDPKRICKGTLFIMGAKANKVLGFGQSRGRLYCKHPDLFKYSGDLVDKEWLSKQNLMPPTGGIAYLLVLDDIRELALSDEYRYNPNVKFNELVGFEAPDFMLEKIRAFISQVRSEDTHEKDSNEITYVSYTNEVTDGCPFRMDCSPIITAQPTAVLAPGPVMPCESYELTDCTPNIITPINAQEFYPAPPQTFVYDNVVYCDAAKINQPMIYSSGPPVGHPGVTSLLVTPINNDQCM